MKELIVSVWENPPDVWSHIVWLWFWFTIGTATYWLKRAYYLVTGPNPVANTYREFLEKCWIPILVRWFLDSMIFWALFTPGFADKIMTSLGWTQYAQYMVLVTQFAVFSAVFGHTVDSVLDFAITKIPLIRDILPQMPPPIKTQTNP